MYYVLVLVGVGVSNKDTTHTSEVSAHRDERGRADTDGQNGHGSLQVLDFDPGGHFTYPHKKQILIPGGPYIIPIHYPRLGSTREKPGTAYIIPLSFLVSGSRGRKAGFLYIFHPFFDTY